jgi:hypothetical protein
MLSNADLAPVEKLVVATLARTQLSGSARGLAGALIDAGSLDARRNRQEPGNSLTSILRLHPS